ncbi:hypothetical protein [Geobacter sp. AOG1]|uniref:hypothetical protein n=1 Tax=Geobacter sp. AOG1 TaxID=1566346 RepID=UPI001CC6662B|nr:hypothetical protein [Geobacter sp. AOG1]GFE57743.1 hypothetical protein AOG1_16230 [Geobacter sp. AOG1]
MSNMTDTHITITAEMDALSLADLVKELSRVCGHGDNFSGTIPLMFGQGGLRQPVISDPGVKAKLVPLLKMICKPLFMAQEMSGHVTFNILNGKLSGLPDCTEQTHGGLEGDEYLSWIMTRDKVWSALKKHPGAPLKKLLNDPGRYGSRKALSLLSIRGNRVEMKWHKHHHDF